MNSGIINKMEEQNQPNRSPNDPIQLAGNESPLQSKKSFTLVIGIILSLLVLVGGYLLFNQNNTKSKIASIKSFEDCKKAGYPILQSLPEQCGVPGGKMFYGPGATETVAQPSPISDPTASWKTYSNKQHNYSFRYPGAWLDTGNGGDQNFESLISFSGAPSRYGLLLQSSQGTNLSQCFATNLSKADIVDSLDVSIAGSSGKKYLVNTSSQEPLFATIYTAFYQSRCYIFEFEYLSKEERDKSVSTSDIILSTFKFTNPTQNDFKADLKTFSSSKYDFSFKYPSIYIIDEYYDGAEVRGYLLKDQNRNTGLKFMEGDGGFGCGGEPKSDKKITLKLGTQTISVEEICGRYPIRVTNKKGAILNIEHYPYIGDPYNEADKKILESVIGLQYDKIVQQ